MVMKMKAIPLGTLMAIALTACHPTTDMGVKNSVEQIFASEQCGSTQPTAMAVWIDDAAQLKAAMERIEGDSLGGGTAMLPRIDFQRQFVLLIDMGQKPSLGYRLELIDPDAFDSTGDPARLGVDWIDPPLNAMVAQSLSNPCLLLKLDRDNFGSIEVLDHTGTLRATANRP